PVGLWICPPLLAHPKMGVEPVACFTAHPRCGHRCKLCGFARSTQSSAQWAARQHLLCLLMPMDDAHSSSSTMPLRGASPFGRVASIALGILATIGSTYFVPSFSHLRPWVAGGDYVPFWNIVGREFWGEGKALAAEAK